MNWWLIVRGYQNGQKQQFMIYADRVTATHIATLVDPKVLSPKKDFTMFFWHENAWSQQAFSSLE